MLLKNLINPIYSASSTLKSLFDKAWEMLTSKQAILIYAVILLVLIIVIILVIMSNEQKRVYQLKVADVRNQEITRENTIKEVTNVIDEKLEEFDFTPVTAYAPVPTNKTVVPYSNEEEVVSEEETEQSRFYMLTEIDKVYENFEHPEYNNEISLKEFCEEFRNY